ncbi:aspartic peptidase domain-containing protein [Mycena epipterygia]|nr:aspartic peptidase domain-containing protein [Mycena epipterygia]
MPHHASDSHEDHQMGSPCCRPPIPPLPTPMAHSRRWVPETRLRVPALKYISNITVNGQSFVVNIDTGSSDFWIVTRKDFVFNDTEIDVTLSYGDGASADSNGTIGFASVEFGGYTSENQAFVNATSVDAGLLEPGLDGLIGLAFNGAVSSGITAALEANSMSGLGDPFLFNVFDQTPDQNNYIGISLSRSDDLEGSAAASFLINEVDQAYAAVVNAPALPVFRPVFPPNFTSIAIDPNTIFSWSILIDNISVDGRPIVLPPSTVPGAPEGKLVVCLDTGTPTGALPSALIDAIYSQIPGSFQDDQTNLWTVPCNTTSIVAIEIGGQQFPIPPLDLSDVYIDPSTNEAFCISPLVARACLFGDTFMRNMYSVFNFGDTISKSPTGNASIQLLSQTDPVAAAADVVNVRMALLSAPAAQNPPSAIVAAANIDSSSSTNSESQVKKYAPIVIGLLGGNLLVVLLLLVIGLVLCVKRGGRSVSRSTKYVPVLVVEHETRPLESYDGQPYSD